MEFAKYAKRVKLLHLETLFTNTDRKPVWCASHHDWFLGFFLLRQNLLCKKVFPQRNILKTVMKTQWLVCSLRNSSNFWFESLENIFQKMHSLRGIGGSRYEKQGSSYFIYEIKQRTLKDAFENIWFFSCFCLQKVVTTFQLAKL